jgi:hypothetical protein
MCRLLILSCSQRKRPDRGRLPAIDRYDGPAFRVLRKYLQKEPERKIAVYVLSSQFGLIPGTKQIPNYDRRMTRERATKLKKNIEICLRELLCKHDWTTIGVCLGRDYLATIENVLENTFHSANIAVLAGGLGKRLSAMKRWLEECHNGKD